METLGGKLLKIVEQVDAIRRNPAAAAADGALPGSVYFFDGLDILCMPRGRGDSRYPYGSDGFNFWACASGYMHCNEGLFSLFLRAAEGQEPPIVFFAGLPQDSGGFLPVPILSVPAVAAPGRDGFQRYAVLTPTAAYYVAESNALRFALRVFPTNDRDLCFSLLIRNCTGTPQRFFTSMFLNPHLRHQIYENGEDRWFKEVRVVKPPPGADQLPGFCVKVNEDKDRQTSISHYGTVRRGLRLPAGGRLMRREETTSRYQYVGGGLHSLHAPAALTRGTFGDPQQVCTFVENSIAGDLLHLELGADSEARLDVVFGVTDDAGRADRRLQRPVDPAEVDRQMAEAEAADVARHGTLIARVGHSADGRLKTRVVNTFFEHLKRQVEFCGLLKGYVQLSENSLIGIRDVFQALEAVSFWQPDAARRKMLEALGFTAPDGRCFRQYSLPSSTGEVGRMDLRPFIDQGCWVISCIHTYVRVTGDLDFLREPCGYHEIVDESAGLVRPSPHRDSVLEHLVRIMDYLLANRDLEHTGCVRALYGDWNDALDGLGLSSNPAHKYGSGVSVMASLQVYRNAFEMAELLRAADARLHEATAARYSTAAGELAAALERFAVIENERGEKRLLHGWGDQRKYLVGSFSDPDGQARDGLTSNAFWVLSGMYANDMSRREMILSAFRRLDSKYGFKTFDPSFPENTPGVGRIPKLPAGTAENGASYIHATAFAIMALFEMGCAREAWEQLIKILPFTPVHETLSHSPFVMPNSYGFNAEKMIDGQSMNDWQTGSSNVVLKTLVRHVFGFEPALGGVWIQPAAWSPFESFEFAVRVRGCDVHVRWKHAGLETRTFEVNGEAHAGTVDSIKNLRRLWIPAADLAAKRLDIIVRD
ncbi:MAG: hypothetical protein JXB04_13405 [Kiritimatiellae bacterium]|nr:hypothetical protein [Kiritimatiellia bacterium]